MKKTKLFAKILFCIIAIFIIIVAALHFTISYIAKLDSVKNKIITIVKEQTFADLKIGAISASIFDFQIKDVDLDIENQNIINVDKVYLHFSLIKLLKGQLKINGISIDDLNIVIKKNIEGKFNFDPIFESPMFKKDELEEKENNNEEEKKDDKDSGIPIDILLHSTQ